MHSEFDRLTRRSTLTAWEWTGLHQEYNLADGHSHIDLDGSLAEPIDDLPTIFRNVAQIPQEELESRFVEALSLASGQTMNYRTCYLHYSCSTSIDMAARALAASGVQKVAVVTPTFDNIAQLLGRAGIELVPIPEHAIASASEIPLQVLQSVDAVFLVLPNNPTGWTPTIDQFEALVAQTAEARKILAIDFSFRYFTDMHLWDQYRILRETPELSWIALEDTGKTWPTLELKLGIAFASADMLRQLGTVTGELLLNVSPLVIELLTRVISADTMARERSKTCFFTQRVVADNREYLRSQLASVDGVDVVNIQSAISVEWLHLDFSDATDVASRLLGSGVAILPGQPFYWDSRSRGSQNIRVALARNRHYFKDGADMLINSLDSLSQGG